MTYSSGDGRAFPRASFHTFRIAAAAATPPSDETLEAPFSEERSKERRRRHQSSADQGRFLTALAVRVSSCTVLRSDFEEHGIGGLHTGAGFLYRNNSGVEGGAVERPGWGKSGEVNDRLDSRGFSSEVSARKCGAAEGSHSNDGQAGRGTERCVNTIKLGASGPRQVCCTSVPESR